MIRNTLPLLLAALATAATAQTPAPPAAPGQPADQPASKPPAEPKAADPAAVNAMLAAPLPADQAAMKAHVLFLASDAMKGREAGSPEYDIAAQYVAAQFYAAGLRPAGDAGGYLQRVPLVTYRAADQGAMTWSPSGGASRTLAFGEDFVPAANPGKAETMVTAPVVFVGYGVRAPGYGHDDYAGVDVRGKIVAFFAGAPARFEGEERAFFGSAQQKTTAAAERDAVGTMTVEHPTGPASRSAAAAAPLYDTLRMTWAKPDGTGNIANPGTPPLGLLSARGARTIFGEGWTAIDTAARRPDGRVPSLTTAGTVTVRTRTSFKPGLSSNVVGMIPGSDPKFGKEVVVLSAHLDHIGVSTRGDGDRINNGALDNAIGIASLIEEAKRFAAASAKPKRTVLFLAVTAEEKGLIGSDYFAEHPTVPLRNIVADVNLDMPILLYPFGDMVAFGGERSTLGPIIRRAVAAIGVALSPDPMPAEGIFVRSDHFRFVQKGIPSVFLWPGQKGAGKAAVDAFMAQRYHKPGDDLTQPILWDQGVRFVDANYRIAREIADAAERPVWNKGDYFGMLYKGPMAK